MHLVTIAPSTTISTDAGRATKVAPGSIIQNVIAVVSTPATSLSTISDEPAGANALVIVPANAPVGIYSLNIAAMSRTSGWRFGTGAGTRIFVTTPHPVS